MIGNTEEVLRALRFELNFLEQGGFLHASETDKPSSPFKDSMVCLNYGKELRSHACRECTLFAFVPEEARTEDIPCHFVPLNESGDTIASLMTKGETAKLDELLKAWLRRTIAQLEREAETSERPVAF